MAGGIGAQSFTVAPESTAGFIAQPPSVTTFAAFGTGRPLWPSDITGLILWLPADQIQGITSGASLSNWTDSSASASHATQPSAVSQPVFFINIQNGLSAVSFGGGSISQFMQSPTSVVDTSTLCVVARPSVLTTANERYVGGAAGSSLRLIKTGAGAGSLTLSGNVISASLGAVWQSLIGSFVSSAGSSAATISQSGTTFFLASTMSGSNVASGLANIGATSASAQTLLGWIGEVMVFNRNLFEIERASLESYMRTKWAI